jgi:hypothetical protein
VDRRKQEEMTLEERISACKESGFSVCQSSGGDHS